MLLRARNAFPSRSSKDDRTEYFLLILNVLESCDDFFNGTNDFWTLFSNLNECQRNFSKESFPRENLEQLVERMIDELYKWRTRLDLVIITESEFNGDLTPC